MRKLIDNIVFKYIELKVWLHAKRNGTTWDKFQYGVFWLIIITSVTYILGKFKN